MLGIKHGLPKDPVADFTDEARLLGQGGELGWFDEAKFGMAPPDQCLGLPDAAA